MRLFWLLPWSVFLHLAPVFGSDECKIHESPSSLNTPSLLKSLQCYNDYQSYVHCKWSEEPHTNKALQLWFETTDNDRALCKPYPGGPEEHRTTQCRYATGSFSLGISHTAFFNKNLTLCSSVLIKPVNLSQHLKPRPPVNLTSYKEDDGGRLVMWSSPYPSSTSSSSSLIKNLTYQLSYRANGQESWTYEEVTNTSKKLEKQLLRPGRRYEARVRGRVSVGQWSNWSPMVTWQTEEDTGQIPSLHCVLDGEKKVRCGWEVSKELVHFITYQLLCRQNQAARSERCCVDPEVSPGRSHTVVKYSCSLTVENPAHLLLELRPTRNAKTFIAWKHIRPDPPKQVKVRQNDHNWMVEWIPPNMPLELRLYYEVCYYRTQDQESSTCLNSPEGSRSMRIPGASLAPYQRYQVKVRSVLWPEDVYKGTPSDWSDPDDWTSHAASWSFTTCIYILISVGVAAVFLTLYCSIPACKRRAVLWVESVPSPEKSQILSEVKSANAQNLMQSENTLICKVLHMDSISTCSSDVSLCLTKDTEKEHLNLDEGIWNCEVLPFLDERINTPDTSAVSFSGPYIFCQSPVSDDTPADVTSDLKTEAEGPPPSVSPIPVNLGLFGEGYVCLPNHSASRSTQDLTSHSHTSTDTQRRDSDTEQDLQSPDKAAPDPHQLSDLTSCLPPPTPSITPGAFISWPQGGTMQASGYCQLPAAFMTEQSSKA